MSVDPRKGNLHRRNVLCGGGAYVFAAMPSSLRSKLVRAQMIASDVHEVDRVFVRVVVAGVV
jgi:hypothetical protein